MPSKDCSASIELPRSGGTAGGFCSLLYASLYIIRGMILFRIILIVVKYT